VGHPAQTFWENLVADNTANKEDSRAQFEATPRGYQERWQKEMDASFKLVEKFYEQGDKVVNRYLDKREESSTSTRLNLFHSGINTVKSMLYGQVPKVDFDRRYADPNDDVARVAAEMYERMLNADIERPDDDYTAVLQTCLMDRLLPGLGQARVRYEAEFSEEQVPAITDDYGNELAPSYKRNTLDFEQAPVDYIHWKDFRWSYCRTWSENRWVAFRAYMDYDALVKRFGKEKADKVPLKSQFPDDESTEQQDAWQKGEIWEIWCKETKHVYWFSEGMDEILEHKADPLKLTTFFPCPRPMLANATSNLLVPKADFVLTQDLYNDIDELQSRIRVLTKAIRIVGVYDKNNPELSRVLKEAAENEMIPVENWAMFAEKKGLEGAVSWFPLEQVVATLDKLRELRDEQIALLYQITGLSDIMRGQSSGSDRVSATEQSIKAKFASVRMQALQDEFARFGTDLIRLKGEVVSKHFQPQTIIMASNILKTPDAQYAMPAVQLLKDEEEFVWRIHVRPESMAMVDYQALQAERSAFLAALAQYLQSSAPLVEQMPGSAPMLMQMLQWGLAGFKGSNQIEAVLDQAISQMQKNPPKEKQDPKIQQMQMEQQFEGQRLQMEQQAAAQKAQLDAAVAQQKIQAQAMAAQAKLLQDQQKHMQEMQQDQQKFLLEMQQMRAEMLMKREETSQKLETNEALGEQKVEMAKAQAKAKPKNDKT
jgi:hypothetical protein